ncbi:fetuin-B-like [Sarcophilus harrisii]|uniref:Cystatin fetuin-B-type domain-containing protein n=1 Tax=Sarcophilus harrisii TaxID=9305 RepID=A0A7N4P343_SARHA|nr:fetuin-B-like [Sarcophilus harrisii]
MILTLSLGLLVLVHGAWSTSPPGQVQQPHPLLLEPSCNDSRVLSVAGFALEKINEDRKEGYVFRLNRVANVREHHQAGSGFVYYLTFDVVDTNCHVLSKKNSKDCETRQFFESIYGQCKAIFYVNLPRRILYLPAYNCTVRPVSRRELVTLCPDCPVLLPNNISDPWIFQTVSESLEEINKEIGVGKKFHLFKVTKVLTYWVEGPCYIVEFLVTESPCTKSLPEKCLPPPADAQPVGICKGSLRRDNIKKSVSGTCEFFQSQPTLAPESHSPEHQVPQQLASTTAPPLEGPKGSVQFLPDPSVGKTEDDQEKKPTATFPAHVSLTTEPLGEVLHLPSHFLLEKEELPIVLPFPEGSRSNECPGPAEHPNSLILPP